MWYVYIVVCVDGTFYTGIAKDVPLRIKAHNEKKGARYTRLRVPVTLVYTEGPLSHGNALKREYAIKRLPKEKKALLSVSKKKRRNAKKR